MPKEIHHSEPISIAEAKELLMQRAKEAKEQEEELSYMQSVALDHAIITARSSGEDARKLIDELIETYRISNIGAISLSNSLPTTIDEVRQILDPESKKMDTETIEAILERINQVDRADPDFEFFEEDENLEFYEDKEVEEGLPEGLEDLED